MAITPTGASFITGAIQTVGSYFATRGVARAEKDAAKAQARLIDLQAEEQRIKNQALRMSLGEQDALLPFAVSNPSLPANAYAGNVSTAAGAPPGPARSTATAGGGTILTVIAIGAVLAFLVSRKVG